MGKEKKKILQKINSKKSELKRCQKALNDPEIESEYKAQYRYEIVGIRKALSELVYELETLED